MANRRRKRLGHFNTVAEREAALYGYINERVNTELPPLTVDEAYERVEARAFLASRLDKNPKNATAHHNLAPIIQTTGGIKRAVQHYLCAITYNPMDLNAMNDLALILFKVRAIPPSGQLALCKHPSKSKYWTGDLIHNLDQCCVVGFNSQGP